MRLSVSATTRSRRKNEKHGRDYFFLDKQEFRRELAGGGFLERTDNFGDLYGTPKGFVLRAIGRGEDVLLAIDVKGASQVRKIFKDAVLVFVLPPSMGLLRKRLKARRTETKEAEARRLTMARKEIGQSKRYDYAIVNDDLKKAVETLKSIIVAERNKIRR